MDGVPCSWSATRAQESFSRSKPASDTLSRLAKLVAQAEHKQDGRNQKQHPVHTHSCFCPECGQGFPDITELSHHQEVKHALPKPHQCLSCGKAFSLLSSLQLHKCVHKSSPCELCQGQQRLSAPCHACMAGPSDPQSPQDKTPHHQPHHLDRSPYACAPCGRGFSQKQALLYHQQAGCSEPPSPLTVDDASSPPADSPPPVSEGGSTHSDSSDAPGPSGKASISCPLCCRTFRTGAGLHCHKRNVHAEELPMTQRAQKTKGGGDVGGEGDRERKFKVNGNLADKRKSKQKLLSCRSCDMVFKSTAKLYLHRKEKHRREKEMRRDTRPVITKRRKGETYPCLVCGRVFLHHLSLMAHSKQHGASTLTGIQKGCQSVGNTAKDSKLTEKKPKKLKNSLIENKFVRAGPGRPARKVAQLEVKFNSPERLREVPKVEEDMDREFPCPSCAEVFTLQSELRDHVELHQSSVRRRQCSVCTQEMDCSKGPGSKRHRLYHCVLCQQAFSVLDTFLEHCQGHLRIKVEEESITEVYNHRGKKN
ncbi:zinc finger protein 616 isoform X2 [Lampris incognitus]|nr:zinc finger protein 616 isoform X2 [Lampris incognitus]